MIYPKRMTLSLSNVCTKNCYYCDFPQFQKTASVASFKNLEKSVKIFNTEWDMNTGGLQKYSFRVEGGEPGELPEEVLDFWYSECKVPKYILLSNGEYFKKGYHLKYPDKYSIIMHHVLAGSLLDMKKDDFLEIPDYGIKQYLVVTGNKNFDLVEAAIKKYPNKEWHISPETICKSVKRKIDYSLRDKILGLIEKYPQVSDSHVKEQFIQMESVTLDQRIMCSNDYSKPYFDARNMKLKRCIASYTNSSEIELTQENFHDILLNKKPLFPLYDEMCLNCEIKEIYRDYFKQYKIPEIMDIINKMKALKNDLPK